MKKLAFAAALAIAFLAKADVRPGEIEHPWFPAGISLISAPIQIPTTAYSVYGVMLDVGYGQVTDSYLLNVGIVNNVTRNMCGFQVGPVNIADCLVGIQGGLVNYAYDAYGFQLGLVNVARHLHGIQLGIINVNVSGFPVLPIFNVGF